MPLEYVATLLAIEAECEQAARDGARRDYLHDLYKKRLDARQVEHDATVTFNDINRRGGHLLAAEQEKKRKAEQEEQRQAYVAGLPTQSRTDAKEPDAAMMSNLRRQSRYSQF